MLTIKITVVPKTKINDLLTILANSSNGQDYDYRSTCNLFGLVQASDKPNTKIPPRRSSTNNHTLFTFAG